MRKLIIVAAAAFALTACSSNEPVTPDDVKPEASYRLNPEQISVAFAKGENAMPADATACMGNVIYKSKISDNGVKIIAEWDGASATGLSNEDLAVFQSEEVAVEMTKCLQASDALKNKPKAGKNK